MILVFALMVTQASAVTPADSISMQQQMDLMDFQKQIFQQITGFTKQQKIDTFLQGITSRGEFNGNVLIAQGDEIIFERSYGYAHIGSKQALGSASEFQIASTSKTFTGVAITQLIQAGKLDLKARVVDILPGFPYSSITVEHLLSHRSGLPDYIKFAPSYHTSAKGSLTNKGLIDLFIRVRPKLQFTPGARFQYCNSNYALLANIVTKISGKSFPQYLADHILKPAGMTQTSLPSPDEYGKLANRTYGYSTSWGWVQPVVMDGVFGDKGIYTTTKDLYLFNRALFEGKLLDKKHQELMYSNFSGTGESMYGLGWRMRDDWKGEKVVYHNGWWRGFRTAYQRRLSDETCVIMLSNKLDEKLYTAARQIFNILDGVDAWMIETSEEYED
jgi:CubicO group peptidase (beta-lactamase class C family)